MLKRLSKPKVNKPTLRSSHNVLHEGTSNPTAISTEHRVYSPDTALEFKNQGQVQFGNYQSNIVSPMVQTQYGWRNTEVAQSHPTIPTFATLKSPMNSGMKDLASITGPGSR